MIKKKNPNSAAEAMKRQDEILPKRRHNHSVPLCMIIDGMGIAYAAKFAYKKLSYKGKSTSLLFGIPQMIKGVLNRYRPDRLIICWDGDRHSKRIKLLPTYKSHRDKKRDPVEHALFHKQVRKARNLLHRLGICQVLDKTVEGDDMIYMVTQKMVKTHRILVVSGDKDFHQMIDHDITIYNPRTNEPIGLFAFSASGVEVPQFVDYLCLVGDDSDDIPGYPGIGPARAAKFFDKFYYIRDYLNSNTEWPGLIDKEGLEQLYRRNRKLIDLKYFCNKYYPENYEPLFYKNKQFPNFNGEMYRKICIKYNLRTMLNPNFIQTFNR